MCASSKLLTLFLVILLYTQTNAGILRLLPTSTPTTTRVTTTTTTKPLTTITLKGITTSESTILENTEATFLPKDIDEKLLTTTTVSSETTENAEEDEDTTEQSNTALSRDEEATVKLAAKKILNPNPDAEVLQIDTPKSDEEARLSKLLLASLPKTSEKPIELEENIEEPVETTDDQLETTTFSSNEITTVETINTEKNEQQLNIEKTSSESESQERESAAVQEMEQKPHVDNAAHEILQVDDIEEYLIIEDDENAEPESETYVHSIQIVPSRLEAVLVENYEHSW